MSGIIFVRHGRTAYNDRGTPGASAERLRGWKDVPLDTEGKSQATAIADKLINMDFNVVYSSPLSRAKDVADAIGSAFEVKVVTDRALMPWNVGDWAGQQVKDVLKDMRDCIADETRKPPNGETFREFRRRYLAFLFAILKRAKEGGPCCIVSHTRNAQAAKAWIANGNPSSFEIDARTMNDYSDELPPGEYMTLSLGNYGTVNIDQQSSGMSDLAGDLIEAINDGDARSASLAIRAMFGDCEDS